LESLLFGFLEKHRNKAAINGSNPFQFLHLFYYMNIQTHHIEVEGLGIRLSTGLLAKQANGAVTIQLADTTVFVSAVAADKAQAEPAFFPLTVDYREKFSAAGRFPGGYFKREGRPSEKEILTSRLCDRPLRPLFPSGFMNEVQIIGFLLSSDTKNEPDVLMVNGASAALMLSDIPWNGPIGCVRLAEIDGQFIVNPTNEQAFESALDLIYVGTEHDMLMIEGSADQMPEERFIEALNFAHQSIQPIIQAQKQLAAQVGKAKKTFPLIQVDPQTLQIVENLVQDRLQAAVFQDLKAERSRAVGLLQAEATAAVQAQLGEKFSAYHVQLAFDLLQEKLYRNLILDHSKRVDGRGPQDLRPIFCKTGVLPCVHGSSLFQRGETQALVTTTLGTGKDAQELDALTGGASSKSFILHYNFPPFSTGEVGRMTGTGRREIGHGALAERSLLPVIPPEDVFPYCVRIVSDIMESNGSSSMASVCGGCLSLMDAGVPILAPVAGISAGLITRQQPNGQIGEHVILTDILGAEDHHGDMDFKIAGTKEGITGFQLDLKIPGLPFSIAQAAIAQITQARHQILDIMQAELAAPRSNLNACAPRIHQIQIDPEKIGALIGPGGKNIKRITENSGAQINILEDNSGRVQIYAHTEEAMNRAIQDIHLMTGEIELGKTYRGIVRGIKEFGVFVECLPGKEGLVHVSELSDQRVEHPEDMCKMGDELIVQCIGVDEKGRVKLSRKAAIMEAQGLPYVPPAPRPSAYTDKHRHRR